MRDQAKGHETGPEANKVLRARLRALEHVLEAVAVLLEVGEAQEALNLIRGNRG